MSYDLQVYARADRLPPPETLSERVRQSHPHVTFELPLDVRTQKGFFPLRVDGVKTGFQLGLSQITEEDIEDYLEDLRESGGIAEEGDAFLRALRSNNVVLHFLCQSESEIEVAKIISEAIARHCHGALIDPQEDTQVDF